MAISVQNTAGGVGGNSNTVTSSSFTSVSGSTIVVYVCEFAGSGAADAANITDSKSNSYTLINGLNQGSGRIGYGAYYNTGGTRGSGHTVTFTKTGSIFNVIGVTEITATGKIIYDSGSFATSTDASSPFNVTAASAVGGQNITFYNNTLDTGDDDAFGDPSGYTPSFTEDSGSTGGLIWHGYKIGETGTPTVGCTKGGTINEALNVFFTFQEVPYVVPSSYSEFSNTTSVTKPSGGTTGDCYVIITYEEPSSLTDPQFTGFTRIGVGWDATGSEDILQAIWYRWHTGSEGSTFSCNYNMYGGIFLVRGANSSINPVLGTQQWEDVGGSPATVRGLKTFGYGSLLLIIQNGWDNPGGHIASTGFTFEGGHSINDIVSVLSKNIVAPGDQSDTTTTWSSGSFSTITAMMSFASDYPEALTVPTIVDRQTEVDAGAITKPLYGQTGDFYVASIEVENAATPSSVGITGFTSTGYVTAVDSPSGITQTFLVLYKSHDGTEPSSFSINGISGVFDVAECFILRGAEPGTPLSNNAQGTNSGGSLSVTGVTTTVDNSLAIIMSHGVQCNSISANNSFSTLAAWDSDTAEIFTRTVSTAGAVGTTTVSYSTSSFSIAAGIIAFPPLTTGSSPSTATPSVIAVSTTVPSPTGQGTEFPSTIAVSVTILSPIPGSPNPSIFAIVASASSVTLLAANAKRRMAVIMNDSAAFLYVKFGATASSSSFTYRIPPMQTLELPSAGVIYTGQIDGIWSAAVGEGLVTEMI